LSQLIRLILAFSFNQPTFCATATWNQNAITFANNFTIGLLPRTIFVNKNNTVYFAHRHTNQISVWFNDSINPTKIITGNFSTPYSLFVTNNGDIYIDNGGSNGRVDKWISNTNTFVPVMNVNSSCMGLFIDINDSLYCSMNNLHQVVKRWLNDTLMTSNTIVAGTGTQGSAPDELYNPYGIFVDVNFDLYVADGANHRIQLFQSGKLNATTVAGNETKNPTITLRWPNGIVLDAEKYLFIVDNNNHRIVGSGPNGFRCLVGCNGTGSQSNQLRFPYTLSFDSSGNMFVADEHNHRIQKFLFFENSCGKCEIV
jgi:hypothetical protein